MTYQPAKAKEARARKTGAERRLRHSNQARAKRKKLRVKEGKIVYPGYPDLI